MTESDEDRQDARFALCAYCNTEVPDEDTVPKASDDYAWAALAPLHAPDCEWVRTRAHRLDDREA